MVRRNKPELPAEITQIAGRQPLSSIFCFTKDMALVSYVPKKGKNVLVLSTAHKEPKVEDGGKRKPQMILDYNKSKGAGGHLDQVSTSCVFVTKCLSKLSCQLCHLMFCVCVFAGMWHVFNTPASTTVANVPVFSHVGHFGIQHVFTVHGCERNLERQ